MPVYCSPSDILDEVNKRNEVGFNLTQIVPEYKYFEKAKDSNNLIEKRVMLLFFTMEFVLDE